MTPADAVAAYGSKAAAARALRMPVSTFKDHFAKHAKGIMVSANDPKQATSAIAFPDLPSADEPLDELIDRCTRHYARLRAHKNAATWQRIKVSDNKPFGIAFLGDPHLDDPGCAWPQLRRDVATLRDTEGLYAINIGDSANSWIGRLARLYANQETSQAAGRRLVEWLLLHSGVRFAAVIIGNHDSWDAGGDIIKRIAAMGQVHLPVHDWQAKIEFAFPNGATCRINASHDVKGRSIYSTTHGPVREAIWNQDGAHIIACGHIHYGGLQQIELPGGHTPWLVRAGSYKEMDSHALVNGFHEGKHFRCPMAIIVPEAPSHERVLMFSSLQQGAQVLAAMRSNYAPKRPRRRTKPKERAGQNRKAGRKPSRRRAA